MKYIIDHESLFSLTFQFIITVTSTYTGFFYANLSAHGRHYTTHSYSGLPFEIHVFELIFLLDFVLKFLTSYNDVNNANSRCKIYDMKQIAVNYYETTFWQDLIPLIPLHMLYKYNSYFMLAFLIKVYRIKKGIVLLNVSTVANSVK